MQDAAAADFDAVDFFVDHAFVPDPYPYFDTCARSARCGASRTTTS